MTVPQVAALLGISLRSAYRAVEAGVIPSIRIGRRILVPTALLFRMLGIDQAFGPDRDGLGVDEPLAPDVDGPASMQNTNGPRDRDRSAPSRRRAGPRAGGD